MRVQVSVVSRPFPAYHHSLCIVLSYFHSTQGIRESRILMTLTCCNGAHLLLPSNEMGIIHDPGEIFY